jgi:hypothetical protein
VCWIDDYALEGVITPAGRLRCAAASKTLTRFFEPARSNQINTALQIKKATPIGVAFLIWWAVLDSNQRPIG